MDVSTACLGERCPVHISNGDETTDTCSPAEKRATVQEIYAAAGICAKYMFWHIRRHFCGILMSQDLVYLKYPVENIMRVMSRFIFVLMTLCLFAACSERSDPGGEYGKVLEIKVAAVTAPKTPWYDMWRQFEEGVHTASGQRMQIKSYLLGQLGSEETHVANLRRNRIQMSGLSLQGAAAVVPEVAILTAPYLYDSYDEVNFIMDNYLKTPFQALFAEQGVVFLRWAEVGWTNVYGKRPYLTPDETKGVKLRSSNSLASQMFIQSIGADVVSLSFGEIVPSLQTGLIDGGSSGLIFYTFSGVSQEAQHMTLTQHAFDTGLFVANKSWYDSLDETQRRIIEDSLISSADARQIIRDLAVKITDAPQDYGITLHSIDENQRQHWKEASVENHKKLIEAIGGQAQYIYDQIQLGKRAFAERVQSQGG